jgi:hypothetical protein
MQDCVMGQIGVPNARTVDPLLVMLGRKKGNALAKSFVRCPSPVSLKSLGPLAPAGSTPAPGTPDLKVGRSFQ